jgi:hypothetical protein
MFGGKEVVITEKMDGENTTIYSTGACHARSLDSGRHLSRDYVKSKAREIACVGFPDGWCIMGENLYAKHSIEYDLLPDYFVIFGVADEHNYARPWDEVEEWANLLEVPHAPVVWRGVWDTATVMNLYPFKSMLSSTGPAEGYVVRDAGAFPMSQFDKHVAKFVRGGHVQPNAVHWMHQSVTPNKRAQNPDYEDGDRTPEIVGSSDPYVLDAALSNHHGPTATVEAEYGDAVVSGSWATLAHHGSRSHNLCPCLEENRQPPPDLLIGVSHFDLDTLGGILALCGMKPHAPDFWRVAARIDTEGPHRLPLMGATSTTKDQINAFWAWSEKNRNSLPRGTAEAPAPLVNMTELVARAYDALVAILDGSGELIEAGRVWAEANASLDADSLVKTYAGGKVLLRSSDRFVNHLYGPQVADAVVAFNTKAGSITLSFSDENARKGLSAATLLQEVFGPLAGGHAGIAGSPRGETKSLEEAAQIAAMVADRLAGRTSNPGYGTRRGPRGYKY